MLIALNFWLGPQREIIIAGDSRAADTQQMFELVRSTFMPNAVFLRHDQSRADPALYKLIPFIEHQIALDSKATAYICKDYTCRRPVNDIDELKRLLGQRSTSL
jgi:uncharacterized protein YyaL (SSP411 family)